MNKQQATLGVVLVLAGLITGAKIFLAPKNALTNVETARSKGNPDARIKIVEFIDFQCPGCAYGITQLKTVFNEHPNDIYLQVKYFPLTQMQHHAMTSA